MRRRIINLHEICLEYMSPEEYPHFMMWAFQRPDGDFLVEEVPSLWNSLHGEDLRLRGDGEIFDDLKKMISLWREKIECKADLH